MTEASLKLKAADRDDMTVIAAVLQDALVRPADMDYADRRFAFLANRFCWENCEAGGDCAEFERVLSLVSFEGVESVKHSRLADCAAGELVSLLTIEVADDAILLVFAGGGRVRLGISRLECHIQDMGEPWPTQWRPQHLDQP